MNRETLRKAIHSLVEIVEDIYLTSVSDTDGVIQEEDDMLSQRGLYKALHRLERSLIDRPLDEASIEDYRKYRAYKAFVIW